MELDEFKTLWQSNDVRLEKRLKLNEQQVEVIQNQKIGSTLRPLYRQRVMECIFHSFAIMLLTGFILKNRAEFPYVLSAIALLVFYITTFMNAFKQIKLIKNIDYSHDLATIQSSLVLLNTHFVNYAKLAILFIPSFLTYPVIISKIIKDFNIKGLADVDIIAKSNGNWWTAEIIAFIILIPIGIWFYKSVTYYNLDKKWVKNFILKSSGNRVTQALEFLKELQSLKRDDVYSY